jgi:hypothetical protein
MQAIVLSFIAIFLVSCHPNRIMENVQKSMECQIIKILFDNAKLDESKNEKFGAIIYKGKVGYLDSEKPDFVLWFKYTNDTKNLVLNYFSFSQEPLEELISFDYNEIFFIGNKQFVLFLKKIFDDKIIDVENAKQLIIPLPTGLQDDWLFNKMYNYRYQEKMGYNMIVLDGDYSWYWGFKSNKIEFVRESVYYDELKMPQLNKQIFNPIIDAVVYHELPEEHKADYLKEIEWRDEFRDHY